jgi:hypothetical protein
MSEPNHVVKEEEEEEADEVVEEQDAEHMHEKDADVDDVLNELMSDRTCLKCNVTFTTIFALKRHVLSKHSLPQLLCKHAGCGKSFARPDVLRRHMYQDCLCSDASVLFALLKRGLDGSAG